MPKPKLIRITTVPVSLRTLLKGQHRFFSENGFEVIGVSSAGDVLDEVSQNEGIPTVAIEMSRKISPFKDLKSLWQFYRFCKKEKPDMVHSHTPKAGIVGMLGAKLAGVPVRIHTVAGLPLMETTGLKRKMLIAVEKLTYACSTGVYPNSKGLYDFILKQKLSRKDKLKIIGNGSSNGVDTQFFSTENVSAETKENLKKELGIKKEDFVFVFAGRLVSDKGINELVEAFSEVSGSKYQVAGREVKLLLVGPEERELDPLKPETLTEIEENPDIISVGYQRDVRPYYAVADALVFPSYREGFPNVVLQSGAMGLPAIVSDINGCNEIITDQKNGLIIPPKDSPALSGAMHKMIADTTLYQYLKSNARPMITARYQQQEVWNALLDEYRQLLKTNQKKS